MSEAMPALRGNGSRDTAALLLPLALLGALLLLGQRVFTVQEDESLIAQQSLKSVGDMLAPFIAGTGHHAHPPLSDVILHFWLQLTGGSFLWFRVPNIAVYVAGVAVLGLAAQRLGGARAQKALYWMALVWPFGFHYGWLFGWFSFGFFFLSFLTWTYLRFLEDPTIGRWFLVVVAAAALVCTNYYGWAVLGLIGIDYLFANPGRFWHKILYLGGAVCLVALAFLPLVRPLLETVSERTDVDWAPVARVLYAGWLGYAFFGSESIAPWVFVLSVPVALATFTLLFLLLRHGPPVARRLVVGFAVLLVAMSMLGVAGSKRAFFLGPWLLLGITVFIVAGARRVRKAGLVCLFLLAAIAWFGFGARRYYGTLRFFDPWPEVIDATVPKLAQRATVVSYHPSFFFYLTYRLKLPADVRPWRLTGLIPDEIQAPRVFEPLQFLAKGEPPKGTFLYIKSAGFIERQEDAQPLVEMLEARCRLANSTGYLADEHSDLKVRFGEDKGHLPYRIQLLEYTCPQ